MNPLGYVSDSISAIRTAVESASRILIVSHDRPDGDAVGSLLAMTSLVEGLGKTAIPMLRDPVPETLRFLLGSERILPASSEQVACDLVIALDSAGRDRIGEEIWAVVPAGAPLLVIDHHGSNPGFGDIDWVEPSAPATGEMVFMLAETAGWKVGQDAAEALYAAISTDTGSFRYPSTSSRTMQIGARLIELGADPGKMNRALYESYPRRRVEALRSLLQGLRFDFDGRCASVVLPLAETERLGLQPGDTEGVIDTIRAVDSVMVAVFFEELPNGKIRVSSRSKDTAFSVADACADFGGGGHVLAAGARLPGPIADAVKRFLTRIRHLLEGERS